MNSSDQDSDLPAGFLIKDKSGQFKKVQDDKIVDVSIGMPKKPVPPPPAVPPLVKPSSVPLPTFHEVSKPVIPTPQNLQPTKPVSSAPTASVFMAPEDEAEIKQHEAKLQDMVALPAGHTVLSVEDVITNIVKQFNVSFSEDVMQKRFAKVVESRLRDLRDSVETKEVLSRSKKIGGLELPPDQAQKVIDYIEKTLSEQKFTGQTPARSAMPEVIHSMMGDAPPPFVPQPKPFVRPNPPLPDKVEESLDTLVAEVKSELDRAAVSAPPTPKPPAVSPVPVAAPAATPVAPVSTTEMYTRPPDELPRFVPIRQAVQERPQVIDIRQPVKVMGPVEELGDINLDEFRRQGTSPDEAADRILEKIDLLEHDSWDMKYNGIKSWKKSPVNALYVEIGRESMESGMTVPEVIRKRIQEKKPQLLMDEFLAINRLNSQLAF